jgi:hypothetical protein
MGEVIDLHSHTTASDGQHSPSELVRLAHAAGVTRLAVTDHDTLAGLSEAMEAARPLGLEVIPGIEVSTSILGVDIHVLGHFVKTDHPGLLAYTAWQEGERRARMERMVVRLNEMGIPVTMSRVEAVAGSDNLCRPHLARALVEMGLCRSTQDAFSRYIGDGQPAYSGHQRAEAAEAIRLIREAGGVATLAHPACDGMDRYQIGQLKKLGLGGLEVFHPDHNPSVREKYLKIARELDLVPTAGSDFHGEKVSPDSKLGSASLDPALFDALRARAAG